MTDTQVATIRQPAREIRVVEDVVPILDTGRFEHMQRIAGAMAQGSLIPETLRGVYEGSGNNRKLVPFEPGMVVANVFRVVNQAVRWNMDPFAVIDCASVVHGRLMWEGKLVHAVIDARVGVRLNYRFGRMVEGKNSDGGKIMRFDPNEEGAGVNLAIQVWGKFDDEDEERTIEGTVADWKTTGAGTPWSEGNYKRQMRYRGAREWARAHAPGVMLGVVTDDEMDAGVDRQTAVAGARGPRVKADIRGKLTSQPAVSGFDPAHVQRETASPEDEDQTPHDPTTGEVIESEVVAETADEAIVQTLEAAGAEIVDVETQPDQPAEEYDEIEHLRQTAFDDGYDGEPVEAILTECRTEAEEAIAREAHAAGAMAKIEKEAADHARAEPETTEPETQIEDVSGPAPKGVRYLLASDEPDGQNMLRAYEDGKGVATVNAARTDLKRYDAHPEPSDPALASQSGGKGQPDPSDKGPLYTELAAMDSWLAQKPRLAALYGSDDFKALDPADQAATRAHLYGAMIEMKERTRDPVDWAFDPSAFGLFADYTALSGDPDAADIIDGTFQTLKTGDWWNKKLSPEGKEALSARVDAMLKGLRK